MQRIPALQLRRSELERMREEYAAQGKHHLVSYIEALIREIEIEIDVIRLAAPRPASD